MFTTLGSNGVGVDLSLQYHQVCPPPNLSSLQRLFQALDENTLNNWLALDTGTRKFSEAVLAGDAQLLMQMVANSECDPPHPFVRRMYELLLVVEGTPAGSGGGVPTTGVRTVTPTQGISPWLTGLFVVGIIAVARGSKRR